MEDRIPVEDVHRRPIKMDLVDCYGGGGEGEFVV